MSPHRRPLRFPILFTGLNKAMKYLGLTPSRSYVVVGVDHVTVRMGWAFKASIPVSSITSVTSYDGRVAGWGVHGWRGRWLVNGSSHNLVDIEIDPRARGRTLVFPLRLRLVRVSVVDRDGLIAAIGTVRPLART